MWMWPFHGRLLELSRSPTMVRRGLGRRSAQASAVEKRSEEGPGAVCLAERRWPSLSGARGALANEGGGEEGARGAVRRSSSRRAGGARKPSCRMQRWEVRLPLLCRRMPQLLERRCCERVDKQRGRMSEGPSPGRSRRNSRAFSRNGR
ncbi:hypothetical protein SORBI_3008G039200 [Sorghum bicolor]|uniref:Uncharacterized protein n=1 Tax=Sorghum bicolor TaxID=4558 RepID=A0A1B6PBE0_SORBI|nr:hypothetical protein SORBI_3008G039200 [Sorghum bicolor]